MSKAIIFVSVVLNLFMDISDLGAAEVSKEPCTALVKAATVSRRDLYLAQSWMKHNFLRHQSEVSMGFDRAIARTGDPQNVGTDVISFGSGPDVFSPLINFPMARNIHLVDSWIGWGEGSGHAWRDLLLRLHAIDPLLRMRLKKQGFMRRLPKTIRDTLRGLITEPDQSVSEEFLSFKVSMAHGYEEESMGGNPLEPMTIELRWNQAGLGEIVRNVFIYLTPDYNESRFLKPLNTNLPATGLAGVIVEGAPYPSTLETFVDRLGPYGFAILEVYSDYPDQVSLLRKLRKSGDYRVRLVHMNTYQRYGVPDAIEQKLYLVQRRP